MVKFQYIFSQYIVKNQYIFYQYIAKNQYIFYQYIAKNRHFISTFCSTFAKSVQEVHWSTYQYEWPPWVKGIGGSRAGCMQAFEKKFPDFPWPLLTEMMVFSAYTLT